VLKQIPAEVRLLSIEPLFEDLGSLDLTGIHWVIVDRESGLYALLGDFGMGKTTTLRDLNKRSKRFRLSAKRSLMVAHVLFVAALIRIWFQSRDCIAISHLSYFDVTWSN